MVCSEGLIRNPWTAEEDKRSWARGDERPKMRSVNRRGTLDFLELLGMFLI